MWWFIKKIEEDDTYVTYAYGYESKDLTGVFSVSKDFSHYNIFEYAKNDDEYIFAEIFRQPLLGLFRKRGFIDDYQLAIG